MDNKKVSIYIPAYNAEKTIEQTLISIKNQTYKFDEIIVINDNSSDTTMKIVSEFKGVKLINNYTNKGLGYNRNLGFKVSKNEIVAAIDADVVLEKKWLENIIKNFEDNKNIICGGRMTEKFTQNNFNLWRAKYYSQNWGEKSFENPPFLFGCNTIQNKSIWKMVKGYNEELFTNGEDIEYINKIKPHKNIKIKYCAEALSEHLQDDNLQTLSHRVWRYHSFGYKIKKPSIYKMIKLFLKQFKFFIKRSLQNILKFELSYIYINFAVLVRFIFFEYKYYKKFKK